MAQDTIGREIPTPESFNVESTAMEDSNLIKPFTYDRDLAIRNGIISEKIKPFTMDDEKSKQKLYLILIYITNNADGGENERDWEFFRGTTQELYDHVKFLMSNDTHTMKFDAMRSKIFVDSPSITIGAKNTSVFRIMLELREKGRVEDNTSFDIHDYYWDVEDIEGEG